jgi:hypothetical protein
LDEPWLAAQIDPGGEESGFDGGEKHMVSSPEGVLLGVVYSEEKKRRSSSNSKASSSTIPRFLSEPRQTDRLTLPVSLPVDDDDKYLAAKVEHVKLSSPYVPKEDPAVPC